MSLEQKIVCYDCKVSAGTFSVFGEWSDDEVARMQWFLMLHDGHRIGRVSETEDSYFMGFPVDHDMVEEWAEDGKTIFEPSWED